MFSCSAVSDSLGPHGLQHVRLLRPPLPPGVCSDSGRTCVQCLGAALVAQRVKRPPAMRETWVRSLGGEDPLAKGKAPHSSILAWRIPWTVQCTVHGAAKSQTGPSDSHSHLLSLKQDAALERLGWRGLSVRLRPCQCFVV